MKSALLRSGPIGIVRNGARVLIDDHDTLRALNDLKRVGHVGCARHAWQISLDFRVTRQPICEVLLLRRRR